MVSRPPDLATLDMLINQVRAEPPSERADTVLRNLQRQRDLLAGPENATGEIGDILRALESGEINTATAASRLAALGSDPRVLPVAALLPLEEAYLGGRITEAQYAEVLAHAAAASPA